VIFTVTVRDRAGMEAYSEQAMPSMAGRTAKVLVVDEDPEVLEGEWPHRRTIVMEFESVDAARDWYRSPEYQAAVPLRQAAADASVVIVPGLDHPGG
jgi:uncharacterized protein (DUF1330 family)